MLRNPGGGSINSFKSGRSLPNPTKPPAGHEPGIRTHRQNLFCFRLLFFSPTLPGSSLPSCLAQGNNLGSPDSSLISASNPPAEQVAHDQHGASGNALIQLALSLDVETVTTTRDREDRLWSVVIIVLDSSHHPALKDNQVPARHYPPIARL